MGNKKKNRSGNDREKEKWRDLSEVRTENNLKQHFFPHNPSLMADFPSFSLGLGLSSDEEKEEPNRKDKQLPTVPEQESNFPSFDLFLEEEKLDFDQVRAPDSNLDPEQPRPFRRLRRGSSTVSSTTDTETPPRFYLPKKESNQTGKAVDGSGSFSSLVDEIEEFSSQEEPQIHDGYMRSATRDASSSSKISLRNQRVLTSQSTTKVKTKKMTPNSASSTLSNLEKSDRTKLFPKLTISPLRKIHVLDTDSDSDNYYDFDFDQKKNEAKMGKKQKEKTSMTTPALDEFCKEYFRSENDLNTPLKTDEPGTSVCSSRVFDPIGFTKDFEEILPKEGSSSEFSNNGLPCYKYFCHHDARISALVKERLLHFTPIGMVNGRANAQNGRETLDYMRQIDPKNSAKSRRSKNIGQKDSPTDVGKRRVQACGQKAGHWLTQDGKKIYVTKDGKEMTGRLAYKQYRRESGAKHNKAKKRGSGNRKKGKQ